MPGKCDLSCSIVLYKTPKVLIEKLLSLLSKSTLHIQIYLIDNSPTDVLKIYSAFSNVFYHFNNKNLGYGAAHNIAIKEASKKSYYHLVLNPDVEFEPDILLEAYNFMEKNPDVGLLSPQIFFPDGREQIMQTMLPNPFDMMSRRLPAILRKLFKKRLDYYFLRKIDLNYPRNVPNLPGSFMFIRSSVLDQVKGFDENFFMYVEDMDLTRRIHKYYKTLYYPYIHIIHTLDRGSNKSLKLLTYHLHSIFYYFKKWGWFVDKDRKKINKQLL